MKRNKFEPFKGAVVKTTKIFRSTKEKDEAKIKEWLNKRTQMKKLIGWFKEKKSWLSLWLLLFIVTTALATCSELKITYEYKTPPVVKQFLSNK